MIPFSPSSHSLRQSVSQCSQWLPVFHALLVLVQSASGLSLYLYFTAHVKKRSTRKKRIPRDPLTGSWQQPLSLHFVRRHWELMHLFEEEKKMHRHPNLTLFEHFSPWFLNERGKNLWRRSHFWHLSRETETESGQQNTKTSFKCEPFIVPEFVLRFLKVLVLVSGFSSFPLS